MNLAVVVPSEHLDHISAEDCSLVFILKYTEENKSYWPIFTILQAYMQLSCWRCFVNILGMKYNTNEPIQLPQNVQFKVYSPPHLMHLKKS